MPPKHNLPPLQQTMAQRARRFNVSNPNPRASICGTLREFEYELDTTSGSGDGSGSESELTDLSDHSDHEEDPDYELSMADETDAKDLDIHESEPAYLDEPLDCTFERGEAVWVHAYGGWYLGTVLRTLKTPQRPEVIQFRVLFRRYVRIQNDFAPVDGTIKRDTPHMRKLLRAEDWIE